jgi:hypothetical protein
MERRFAVVAALVVFLGCDQGPSQPPDYEPPPPGPGPGGVETLTAEQGWTVHIPPFPVPAGAEVTDCYFLAVPDLNDGQDIWIDQVRIGQRPGSHHLNIFRVNTVIDLDGAPGEVVHDGECKNLPNWADWPLVANSQNSDPEAPAFDWILPDTEEGGVAHRFHPGEKIMLQTHYVNATNQVSPEGGEVKVNFYLSRDAKHIELGTFMGKQQEIRICQSNPTPSFSGNCHIPSPEGTHIAAANGHFHSRGQRVSIYPWDGLDGVAPPPESMCYESLSWDEPPMSIDMDELVPAGGGFWWTCEFAWTPPPGGCDLLNMKDPQQANDCCYVFGNNAENAEHCNVFVYYWPAVEYTSIYCDP